MKSPDYFLHIPTNTCYQCVGSDEGKYWTQINDPGDATGFDMGDCQPLAALQPSPLPLVETKKVWNRIVHMDEQQWRECDPDEQAACIKRWTEQQYESVPLIETKDSDSVDRLLGKYQALQNFAIGFCNYFFSLQEGNKEIEQGFHKWMDTEKCSNVRGELIKQFESVPLIDKGSEAIEFTNWLTENNYYRGEHEQRNYYFDMYGEGVGTAAELYQLFKNKKQ